MVAFLISKGLEKHQYYLNGPGIVLVDSKPVYQAAQKMSAGKFSSNVRLQDLLENITSKRMTVQLISVKLPSPLLSQVDFASRNPIKYTLKLLHL